MKRFAQLLLITILATAATATYEYDPQFVQEIRGKLHRLPAVDTNLFNMNVLLEWRVDTRPGTGDNVYLGVVGRDYSGPDCIGGPGMTLDKSQRFCLIQMVFQKTTLDNGKTVLDLGLVFRATEYSSKLRATVAFNLFRKPTNEAAVLEGVVQVEPITKEQLKSLRSSKSFHGTISWLDGIFKIGIHVAKFDMQPQPSINNLALRGYPIVVDSEILDEILQIPSLELGGSSSSEMQNAADLDTSLRL